MVKNHFFKVTISRDSLYLEGSIFMISIYSNYVPFHKYIARYFDMAGFWDGLCSPISSESDPIFKHWKNIQSYYKNPTAYKFHVE